MLDAVSSSSSTESSNNSKPTVTSASPASNGKQPNDNDFDKKLDLKTTNGSDGYNSFGQLKNTIGPAGEGNQWHHIVEQCQIRKSGFDVQMIQNKNNITSISKDLHKSISGYYKTTRFSFTDGLSVRNWLNGKSFAEQYEFGLNVIKIFGGP